ncbi:MAG: DUF4105 domain-containing protein [Candidatus Thiodiazotropha sp.]
MMRFAHLLWILGCLWSYDAIGDSSSYLNELIARAQKEKIAKDPNWLALGHYRKGRFYGYISDAASPKFFLAPDGPSDPEAELIATLQSLFSAATLQVDEHPQCLFIARHHWLRERLRIDPARLRHQPCTAFDTWYSEINPGSITLVFPSAYINSPSSMFGHTLLRIDPRGPESDSRLFSYAVNFAANTDETNGLVFAVKGLTGLYPGGFSLMPYYDKVQEYAELENRDMWEYELNLEPSEIRRILEHLWELRQIPFPYYFFNKNCSYQLLALLEVARPGLSLTGRFQYWAIPSDTVRAILENDTILRRVVYRPSEWSKIEALRDHLNAPRQALAFDLAVGQLTTDDLSIDALPTSTKADTLELAYRYLRYQYTQNLIAQDISAERSLALLSARSKLPAQAEPTPVLPPTRPDSGHRSARIALGLGRQADTDYGLIRLRPAYHDLLDDIEGYSPGAQINFFDLSLRYDSTNALELEDFTVIDITSITPRDRFFRPISWHVDTGYGMNYLPAQSARKRTPYLRAGAGYAFAAGNESLFALFAESSALRHSSLRHKWDTAVGASLRWLWKSSLKLNLMLSARHSRWLNNKADENEYKLGVNWAFDRQWAVRGEFHRNQNDVASDHLTQISLQHYF